MTDAPSTPLDPPMGLRLVTRSILYHSRAQPLADKTQEPPVCNPMLDKLHQPPVLDGVEEATDVRVEHPVHFPSTDSDRECVQSLMLAAPG